MREYKLYLKGAAEPVLIQADDVNMVSADGPSFGVFLNFWARNEASESGEVTVAAVPLGEVHYVVSA